MSPKSPAWLTQLSYPVDSKLYPNLCIARSCFKILMLRSFQFNALSRGNQRPNLPYKKTWRDTFGGIRSTSVATRNSATLLLEPSLLNIDISLTTIIFYKYLFTTSCNITSSRNKPRSLLHITVSCCGLEFQFLGVPTHSRLPSRPTRSIFYVPNPPSPWDTTHTHILFLLRSVV
jgi:hypothetical protein